jgi:hypothetical protein
VLLQLRHTWKMDIPLLVAADDWRRANYREVASDVIQHHVSGEK